MPGEIEGRRMVIEFSKEPFAVLPNPRPRSVLKDSDRRERRIVCRADQICQPWRLSELRISEQNTPQSALAAE